MKESRDMKTCPKIKHLIIWITILVIAASLLMTGCGSTASAKTYTIGVVNYHPTLNPIFDGLKAGLAELGYVEGKNVNYIFNGILKNDPQVLDAEIKNLLDRKVDLLFTLGDPTTLAAKKAVEGTTIPVVFAPPLDPVGTGMVKSLRQPGGNLTGVQRLNVTPKLLEWLLNLAPGTRQVYVPYHPADEVALKSIKPLPDAAAALGVELILSEVQTAEEVVATINTLPEDTAILFVPSPAIEPGRAPMFTAATERGLAVSSYVPGHLDAGALVTYTADFLALGKQTARLVDQIFKGTAPAVLPVETDEAFLGINLKTAQAIGLSIPDEILRQAKTVIH